LPKNTEVCQKKFVTKSGEIKLWMIATSATSQCWQQKTHITIIKNKLCHQFQYQLMVLLPCVAYFIPNIITLHKIKWDAIGNSEGTWWEHIGNNKNSKVEQPQLPQKKKNWTSWVSDYWLISFAPKNFYVYLCSLPFRPNLMVGAWIVGHN